MKHPKITIVTPSYNQGVYLDECLDSILSQSYDNFELIVVDGGSTDNSVEVIKKYEHHLAYWVSEKDKGQSDAINKGIRKASGDVFNWINSDDVLYENALEHIAECFSEPSTRVVSGLTRRFESVQNTIQPVLIDSDNAYTPYSRLEYNQHGTFYSMEFIKNIQGVNEGLHYCMDKEIWLKYLFQYGLSGIKVVNKEIAGFRIQESSKTSNYGVRFDNEYASILYQLATSRLPDLCKVLENKFDINKQLDIRFHNLNFLTDETLRNMIFTMLINHGHLVFNKTDFEIGKSIKRLMSQEDLNNLALKHKDQYDRLLKSLGSNSWLGFRIRRKLRSFTK